MNEREALSPFLSPSIPWEEGDTPAHLSKRKKERERKKALLLTRAGWVGRDGETGCVRAYVIACLVGIRLNKRYTFFVSQPGFCTTTFQRFFCALPVFL